jgi:hypothetical protein
MTEPWAHHRSSSISTHIRSSSPSLFVSVSPRLQFQSLVPIPPSLKRLPCPCSYAIPPPAHQRLRSHSCYPSPMFEIASTAVRSLRPPPPHCNTESRGGIRGSGAETTRRLARSREGKHRQAGRQALMGEKGAGRGEMLTLSRPPRRADLFYSGQSPGERTVRAAKEGIHSLSTGRGQHGWVRPDEFTMGTSGHSAVTFLIHFFRACETAAGGEMLLLLLTSERRDKCAA